MKHKIAAAVVFVCTLCCCGRLMFAQAGSGIVSSGSNFELFQAFMNEYAAAEEKIGSVSGVPGFVSKYYDADYQNRDYYTKYDGETRDTVSNDLAALYGASPSYNYYLSGGRLAAAPTSVKAGYILDGYRDMGANRFELYLRRNFSFTAGGKTYTVDAGRGCILTVKNAGGLKLYGNHAGTGDVIMHNGYSMNFEVNYRDGSVLWNTFKEASNVGGHDGGIVAVFAEPSGFNKNVLTGLSGLWNPVKYAGTAPANLTWQQLSLTPGQSASGFLEYDWLAKSNDAYASLAYTYDGFYDRMRSVSRDSAIWWAATLQPFSSYTSDAAAGTLGAGPYMLGSEYGKKWNPGWIEFTPNGDSFKGTRAVRTSYILPFRGRYEAAGVFNFYDNGVVKGLAVRPELIATKDASGKNLVRLDVKFQKNGVNAANDEAMLRRFYRIRIYYWKDGVERNDNNLTEISKNFDLDYKWNAQAGLDEDGEGTNLNVFWKLASAIPVSSVSRVDISGIELSDGSSYRLTYHWCDPIPGNVASSDVIHIGTGSGDVTSDDTHAKSGDGSVSGDEMNVASVDFKVTPRYWATELMPFDYTVRLYVGKGSGDAGGYGYAVADLPDKLRTYVEGYLTRVNAASTQAEKTAIEDELYKTVLGYIHIYKDCGTRGRFDLTKIACDYIKANPSYKLSDFFTIYPEELSGVVSPTDRVLIRFTMVIKDGGSADSGVEAKVGETGVDAVTYRKGYFYYEDGVVESKWNHQFSDPIFVTKTKDAVAYQTASSGGGNSGSGGSSSGDGGGGGGCSAGFMPLALLPVLALALKRRRK